MTEFTPVSAFIGGSLIGLSALLLMLLMGKVAGCSGIITASINEFGAQRNWRLAFIIGLIVGPVLAGVMGFNLPSQYGFDWPQVIIGGLLVGMGAGLGSGCTSGHGICGMGRFSARSIVATCTFMLFAFVTVFITQHVF